MTKHNNSRSISSNVGWRLAERIGAQSVSFIVSVVLARMIDPEDYGLIALVTVISTVLNVLVQSGLGTALIQKKEVDILDFSIVLWFNISMSIVLYGIVYFVAPLIGTVYQKAEIIPVVRVMSLSIIISGINSVQQAYISRSMKFRVLFFSSIIGTSVSGCIGIALAYRGMGVWALVWQILFKQLIDTLVVWKTINLKYQFTFSFQRFRPLYSFGWKVLVSNLLDTLYKNLRTILIGTVYTERDLGYYNRGIHFPELIITNVNAAIQSVFYPAYSACNDDYLSLKRLVKKSISMSTYLIFPLMTLLAMIAPTFISLLYTDKWLPAVPYMQISCLTFMLWPLHTANLQAIQALGRSDITMRLEIIKKVLTVGCLLACLQYGVYVVAVSAIPLGVFSLVMNAYPNKKLFDYRLTEQLKDIFPAIWMCVVMGGFVYLTGLLAITPIALLFLQILVALLSYIGLSLVMKNSQFLYLINKLKDYRRTHK